MPEFTDEQLAELSRRLGYDLIGALGEGGFGQVYLARQRSLDRPCAVKVLRPDLARDAEFRTRFEREGRAASRLDHPNLVTVYDQGERDGLLFIAMQYVEGRNLRDVIDAEAPLHPERAVALIEQGAAALDAVHRGGLIHRDVKPENFLVRRRPGGDDLLLTDFGIAAFGQETSRFTSTSAGLLLTPQYAAPERWQGSQGEPATDVYALACVLFECLTGHPPYVRPTDISYSAAHLFEEIPDVCAGQPFLPAGLGPVIARGLAKNPRQRWQSAGEMLTAARQVLAARHQTTPRPDDPIGRFPTQPSGPAAPLRVQKSSSVAVLVMGVLAVVAVAAAAFVLSRNPSSPTKAGTVISVSPAATSNAGSSQTSKSETATTSQSSQPTPSTQTGSSGGLDGSGRTPPADVPISSGETDANSWMAQLASIPVGNARELESQYRSISAVIPTAKVIRSDDFASLRSGYWVIYQPGPFPEGSAAVQYCQQQGRAVPHDCFGRYLSHNSADQTARCYSATSSDSGPCAEHRTGN